MSLYTDPTLFFRQWLYNMNREANVLRNPKKKRVRRSRSSIKPGQALYIAPPSASPPPPLSYPVYENRDLVDQPDEDEEENLYEMLPDQENSPPPHQSSPQQAPFEQNTSIHFNQQVHCNQSYQFNQSGHFASSPQHQPSSPYQPALTSPPHQVPNAELNVSAHDQHALAHEQHGSVTTSEEVPSEHGNSFQRNRSYDLSMQFERQGDEFHNSLLQLENNRLQFDNSSPSRQYTDSPQLDSRTQPRHFNDQYGHLEDAVLPVQNSLTSLSLDTHGNRQQQSEWQGSNQIYDNHRLQQPAGLQPSVHSGGIQRFPSDPTTRHSPWTTYHRHLRIYSIHWTILSAHFLLLLHLINKYQLPRHLHKTTTTTPSRVVTSTPDIRAQYPARFTSQ
ncbi:uncharacterized protein LOC134813561 [Bolinopsis microptera]|uniref:uncharacterized protein LOC134813561 n=1 Tax=Bolinopsis microptera TaxID=2820187 RepID=UPI003078D005